VTPNDRTVYGNGVNPSFETDKHATLVFPPALMTHAIEFFGEYATATGYWPSVFAGLPARVNLVGSVGSTENMDNVLSPALTTKTYCFPVRLNP